MMKHMFRRVKEGIIRSGLRKFIVGSVFMALLPSPLLIPNVNSQPASPVWQTRMVLAESSPELLAPRDDAPKIEITRSRYDEEQAKLAAAKKRSVAKTTIPAQFQPHPLLGDAEKVELANTAAAKYGVPSQLIWAVWGVETGHRDGCITNGIAWGPAQFVPGTFRHYAVDGNGDGQTSICDARDAIPTMARMLAANGAAQGDYHRALFAYNHADWYVHKVLAIANM